MKKINLALILLIAFAACKKNNETPIQEDKKLADNIEVKILGFKDSPTSQQGSLKYNFLGYGYDVTDEFDDEQSVRAEVVNTLKFAQLNKNGFSRSTSTSRSWNQYCEDHTANLLAKLSNKFKETQGLKLFKNTIIKSFPNSNAMDDKYNYGYYTDNFIMKRMFLVDDYLSQFTNYPSSIFAKDLESLKDAELVKKYGTHVLTKVNLGSKLTVFYQTEVQPSVNRKKVTTTGLEYAVYNIFRLITSSLGEFDLSSLNANKNAKINIKSIGGDHSKLFTTIINGKKFINTNEWNKSRTFDNIKFIGVNGNDGLMPLYEFIKEPSKKASLKTYIENYIKDNEFQN